jgi:hypothetical protein
VVQALVTDGPEHHPTQSTVSPRAYDEQPLRPRLAEQHRSGRSRVDDTLHRDAVWDVDALQHLINECDPFVVSALAIPCQLQVGHRGTPRQIRKYVGRVHDRHIDCAPGSLVQRPPQRAPLAREASTPTTRPPDLSRSVVSSPRITATGVDACAAVW